MCGSGESVGKEVGDGVCGGVSVCWWEWEWWIVFLGRWWGRCRCGCWVVCGCGCGCEGVCGSVGGSVSVCVSVSVSV